MAIGPKSDPNVDPNFSWPVGRAEFDAAIKSLWTYVRAQRVQIKKLEIGVQQMASQADVDALTAALNAEDAELGTAVSGLQGSVTAIAAEIAALQAAQPALDLSALSAEVANSQAQADAVAAAVASAAALVPPAPPAV